MEFLKSSSFGNIVLGFSMYIPGEYPKQILKLLETYKPLRGTVAYSKLEELSKIKVF